MFFSFSMAEYFFYTTEGFTQDPNGNKVENCQALGRAFGEDMEEAKNNLLKANRWIKEHGFDTTMFRCEELAPCKNADKKLSFLIKLLDKRQLDDFTTWLKSIED